MKQINITFIIIIIVFFVLFVGTISSLAQENSNAHDMYQNANEEKSVASQQFSKAIEDNSFFVEEAFNQEDRIVQHISNAVYFRTSQDEFLYSFTQEWPMFGQAHQFSFTLPYARFNSGTANGIGDIMLNYRYQLFTAEHWVAVAPRISLILPTGNSNTGIGNGVVGIQLNLPVSKRLSEHTIAHFNVGMTLLPNVKGTDMNGAEITRTLPSYNTAMSFIWLVQPNFNIMIEAAENFTSEIDGNGDVASSNETIISPGIRYAIDIDALQIVPGIAFPFSFSQTSNRNGMFLYLSFEHPF